MIDMRGCVWREYDRHDRVCVEGSMMDMTGCVCGGSMTDMTGCVWGEYDRHDRVCVEGSMWHLWQGVWRAA